MPPETAGKPPPPRTTLSLRDTALGLSLSFHAPGHLDPGRAGLLLRDEVPVIRRFLDDPVNWPVVGRRPDAKRNALLALLLSADRVGGEDFAVLPIDHVCDVRRHAQGYSGPPCPLCAVIRLIGRLSGEKLVRIVKVIGEADDKGHYLLAEKVCLEPGPELDVYRDKILRLALPPVLRATRRSQKKLSTDPAATWVKLSTIPVQNWGRLNLELTPDGFKANGVKGFPGDLGLAQHEWDLLCDIAKAGGDYSPALIGPAETRFRKTFAQLCSVLKKAFPQIAGEPLKRSGSGTVEAMMQLRLAGRAIDGVW